MNAYNPGINGIANTTAQMSLTILNLLVVLQSRAKDTLLISNMVHQYTNDQIKKISPGKLSKGELINNKPNHSALENTSDLQRQIENLSTNQSVKIILERFCLSLVDINEKIRCLALITDELDSILIEHVELFSQIEGLLENK